MTDRRSFFKTVGAAASGAALSPLPATAGPLTEKEKLARIASNTWPIRYIFKSRTGFGRGQVSQDLKKKYGEITMLDFPQFTKDTFPGVTHMDLFSGLFGDVTDDSMYVSVPLMVGAATRVTQEFDPSSAAGKRWLDKMANKMAGHRHQVPAHLQQRAARHLRAGCGEAQGRHRGGQEVAGRREDAGREIDAGEQRRSADRAAGGGHGGLSEGRRTRQVPDATASRASRRWRTTAPRWA